MKKIFTSLLILGLAFVFIAGNAHAADIGGSVAYTPTGATVGTSPAASATLSTFDSIVAISGGHWITLTLPVGTVLNTSNIAASDFTIEETGAGSAATAPVSVTANAGARTLTFVVHPASISTDSPGIGTFTVKLAAGAGGNEIVHPTLATAAGSFTVATEAGDTGTISNVAFVAANLNHYDLALTVAGTKTANADFTMTITAHDVYSNKTTKQTDGTALGTETFTITSNATAKGGSNPTYGGASLLDGETAALDIGDGDADTGNFKLFNAGETPTVTVSADSVTTITGTSAAITVGPAVKNKLAFNTQPSTMSYRGALFMTQPKVEIQDAYGNRTADTDNIVVVEDITATACNGGQHAGTLGGTLTKAAVSGLATYTNLTFDTSTAGANIYLKATSGGLTQACSSGFYISTSASAGIPPVASVVTTTTSAGTTTTTAAGTTTTTSAATVPTTLKPVAQMTQTEKNAYIVSLQTFLVNLLQQLVALLLNK